jgi:hypothetical protein
MRSRLFSNSQRIISGLSADALDALLLAIDFPRQGDVA